MLIYYRKNQGISRNFDYTGEGFVPLPLKKNDTNQKTSDDLNLKTSNSTDENASANPIPGSLIKPGGFKNLLQDSLVKQFEKITKLFSSSDRNNNNLLDNNSNNNNENNRGL